MRRLTTWLFCALITVATGSAAADTLTAVETTLASGSLSSYGSPGTITTFTNALVTFSYTGDAGKTYSVYKDGGYDSLNYGGTQTITVAGLGTYTSPVREVRYGSGFETAISSDSGQSVGYIGTYSQSADGQGFQNISTTAAFGPYTLASSFGPIAGSTGYFVGGFSYGYPAFDFGTGYLQFSSFDPTITFQATVTPSTITAEPSSFLLLGTGLCVMAGAARWRCAHSLYSFLPLKKSVATI